MPKDKKPSQKRLMLRVDATVHYLVRMEAAKKNITIDEFCRRAVVKALPRDAQGV